MARVLWSLPPSLPLPRSLDLPLLRTHTAAMLGALRCAGWDVGVVFDSDEAVRELNRTYRGVDRPTDVLSFPFHDALERPGVLPAAAHDGERNLGDIFLAWPYVEAEAARDGVEAQLKATRLVAHGVCHLAGCVRCQARVCVAVALSSRCWDGGRCVLLTFQTTIWLTVSFHIPCSPQVHT